MIDQATELRKLVLRSMRERAAAAGPPPRLLVLTGGQPGAGVTTLTVNMGIALADQGLRVVVVDADPHRADVARLCGLPQRALTIDVRIARTDIHEVLQRGPAGIQVVPGLWAPGEKVECDSKMWERLLRQFHNLGPHADVVLLDAGRGGEFLRRFASVANDVLTVITADVLPERESHVPVRAAMRLHSKATAWLVVNRCEDEDSGAEGQRRRELACQQMFGNTYRMLGEVPEDAQVRQAAAAGLPLLLAAPNCPASRSVQRLATGLAADWPDSSRYVA